MKIKKHNLNKGFTIVEIMVVVAISAILLTIILTNSRDAGMKTRDKVRVADINTIRLALEEYKLHCGEYPARLELDVDNGCHNGESLSDYLVQIPQVPNYSTTFNFPEQGLNYFYYGMSSSTGGKCYDYIIGVQLEYGADNDFNDGENSKLFSEVNQESLDSMYSSHKYSKRCNGSLGTGIVDAEDSAYGIYGFRSTMSS
jgi:prepilin-type N-terminal cleavage/methylation domain-containing protein